MTNMSVTLKGKNLRNRIVKEIFYFCCDATEVKHKPFAIAYGVDQGYFRQMVVSISSIARHNSDAFFLVAINDLNDEQKKFLEFFCKQRHIGMQCYIINPDCGFEWPIFHQETISIATYYRFFLFEITEIPRILYVDADILNLQTFGDIFDLLRKNSVAAVPDLVRMNKNNARLELPKQHKYFNAGVLLVDTVKWHQKHCFQKAMNLFQKYRNHLNFEDQDVLNIIFSDDVTYLSVKYNTLVLNGRVSEVSLLHFASHPKPWSRWWCLSPLYNRETRTLWQDEEMSCFGSVQQKSEKISMICRFFCKKIGYRFLPGYRQG